MEDLVFDCDDVEERDLEILYVTGRLAEPEAEAFEAHYMGCDRCFRLVRRALEIRAAEERSGSEAGGAAPAEGPVRRAGAWVSGRRILLAAAAVAVLALAGAWWGLIGRGAGLPEIRHPEASLAASLEALRLTVHPHPTRLRVSWATLPGAEAYHASLLTGEGLAVHEQVVTDTMASVAVSQVVELAEGGELYWHVDAVDASGLILAHAGPEEAGLGRRRP